MDRIRLASLALALVLLLAAIPSLALAQDSTPTPAPAAGDWPMFRGNPAQTGAMPGSGPVGQPLLLWRFKVGDSGVSSPVVAAGLVFSSSGDLFALDALTGRQAWRSVGYSTTAPAAVEGNLVFIHDGGSSNLVALEAGTGTEQWSAASGGGSNPIPIVAAGVVYGGSFTAIEAASGTVKWSIGSTSYLTAAALADGLVFHLCDVCDSGNDTVVARDAETGDERWQFPLRGDANSSPAVADGLVYVADAAGNLSALNAETGAEWWRFVAGGFGSPAVAAGLVYVGGSDGNVYALDATNGQERWRFTAEGAPSFSTAPAVVEGVVYVGGSNGNLYALDAMDGTQRWAFPIEGGISSAPAVANGIVYLGSSDGFLYAIGGDAGPGLAAGATPGITILPIDEGVTVEVNDNGVLLRGAPSAGAVEIEGLPPGTRLTVLGSREERDGSVWWRVQVVETGATGYVEEQYLTVVAGPA